MNNHVQITIAVADKNLRDELVAQLSLLNFEGFEETDTELICYVLEDHFPEKSLVELLSSYNLSFSKSVIEPQNWNALWEGNFMPVIVEDFCSIRAEFHPSLSHTEHEIIITPKMSFGTGHHATTYLMVSEMRQVDFTGKKVADFGTGTGILAILAEKLGAKDIVAIDYDEWSIENALENIEKNNCSHIVVKQLDSFPVNEVLSDIILANINKNVILDNMENMVRALQTNGTLLLSGLLKSDEDDILKAVSQFGLNHIKTREKDNWIIMLFKR